MVKQRKGVVSGLCQDVLPVALFVFSVKKLMMMYSFQVGLQASASMSIGVEVGDEVKVQVEEAHPRDDILSLKEVSVAE